MRHPYLSLLTLAFALLPGGLLAQVPTPPPEPLQAPEVLERVRQGGGGALAAAFLTQEGQPRTAGELDAFADSLVEIAMASGWGDPRELQEASRQARLALMASADPGHLAERAASLAERGLGPPIPYPRALSAMVRVFEGSPHLAPKAAVVRLVTNLPDTARVVAFLSEVATDPAVEPGVSVSAVQQLASSMGEPGLSRLRTLFESESVSDPTVRERLNQVARVRGWVRNGGAGDEKESPPR